MTDNFTNKVFNKKHRIEILAPAGSTEALIAAVRSGADAVYFGAELFNARINASNFKGLKFDDAVKYCRRFGVRSYLTLNTVIGDSEISDALKLAERSYILGMDGIIIQDIGLASLLHKHISEIKLHASTQMTVHSPSAVKPLARLGFKRIVAAREMSQSELSDLCYAAAEYGLETEVFIHGALCMCISGQCYFSATLGGRSANRGLCAGTCRLPFFSGESQNALSLKDLSLIDYIKNLEKIGVASAKIEGRMKRPEYVAAAVHCAVNAAENGHTDINEQSVLRNVFSRSGFTDGYYKNALGKDMFGARTKDDAASPKILKSIHEYYRHEPQNIPIEGELSLSSESTVLKIKCGDYIVEAHGQPAEKAEKIAMTEEKAGDILSKLGSTPYFLKKINLISDGSLTVSASVLSLLKNELVKKLDNLRIEDNKPVVYGINTERVQSKRNISGLFARFADINQIPDKTDVFSDFSLPVQILLENATIDTKAVVWAELSRTAFDETIITRQLDDLSSLGLKRVICSNAATIELALSMGFEVIGGFGLNIYNSFSADYYSESGLSGAVLSPELSLSQISHISPKNKSFRILSMCYGRLPLMITRNCPVKSNGKCINGNCFITDRLNEKFPLVCHKNTFEILNSRVLEMSDRLNEISANSAYLYFTIESKKEVLNTVENYKNQKKPTGSFTRGLFSNGVVR